VPMLAKLSSTTGHVCTSPHAPELGGSNSINPWV
jgi:hypothetical protein